MARLNLDEYESVEERIKRFYADHKDGAIHTFLKSDANNMDYAVFEAHVIIDGCLKATGWAQEMRDKEKSMSSKGFEYESVNYTSWLENAETSAIGRALANFNYAGNKRPSREEMKKVMPKESTEMAANYKDALNKAFDDDVITEKQFKEGREYMKKHENDPKKLKDGIDRLIERRKEKDLLDANTKSPPPEISDEDAQQMLGGGE